MSEFGSGDPKFCSSSDPLNFVRSGSSELEYHPEYGIIHALGCHVCWTYTNHLQSDDPSFQAALNAQSALFDIFYNDGVNDGVRYGQAQDARLIQENAHYRNEIRQHQDRCDDLSKQIHLLKEQLAKSTVEKDSLREQLVRLMIGRTARGSVSERPLEGAPSPNLCNASQKLPHDSTASQEQSSKQIPTLMASALDTSTISSASSPTVLLSKLEAVLPSPSQATYAAVASRSPPDSINSLARSPFLRYPERSEGRASTSSSRSHQYGVNLAAPPDFKPSRNVMSSRSPGSQKEFDSQGRLSPPRYHRVEHKTEARDDALPVGKSSRNSGSNHSSSTPLSDLHQRESLRNPTLTDPVEAWYHYYSQNYSSWPRGVRRDGHGGPMISDLRADRAIALLCPDKTLRHRAEGIHGDGGGAALISKPQFKNIISEMFSRAGVYQERVESMGLTVAKEVRYRPYDGPSMAMDDIVRHLASCGLSFQMATADFEGWGHNYKAGVNCSILKSKFPGHTNQHSVRPRNRD